MRHPTGPLDPRDNALIDHQIEMQNLQIEREITHSTAQDSPRANANLSPAAQAYQALQSQGCENPTPDELASAIAEWKAQHHKTDERRLDILGLATPMD